MEELDAFELVGTEFYYKCTACSECFITEEIFFAHTRTWHCRLLVCEGQNPNFAAINDDKYDLVEFDNQCIVKAESDENNDCVVTSQYCEGDENYGPDVSDFQSFSNSELRSAEELAFASTCSDIVSSNKPGNNVDKPVSYCGTDVDTYEELPTSTANDNCAHEKTFDSVIDFVKCSGQTSEPVHCTVLNDSVKELLYPVAAKVRPEQERGVSNTLFSNSNLRSTSPFSAHRCHLCSKTFNNNANLRVHLRIHTGARPYNCDVCGKCFRHSNALKRHSYIHFKQGPVKTMAYNQHRRLILDNARTNVYKKPNVPSFDSALPLSDMTKKIPSDQSSAVTAAHKCRTSIVDWTKKQKSRLDQSSCSKGISKQADASSSETCQAAAKKNLQLFKCFICNKTFRNFTNLNIHQRIHTGAKPYSCYICGKHFRHSNALRRHERLHVR